MMETMVTPYQQSAGLMVSAGHCGHWRTSGTLDESYTESQVCVCAMHAHTETCAHTHTHTLVVILTSQPPDN